MSEENSHFDVCIIQPSYLPWLGYFDQMSLADIFVFYDDVQFDKNGWRNRNRLLNNGKPQWITVPVITKNHFNKTLREITISDSRWQTKHLKTIKALYGKSPFFDKYFPHLEAFLLKRKYKWLCDLCVECIDMLCSCINIKTKTVFSSDLGHCGVGRTERLVKICKHLGASRYISADASKSYMKENLWREAGIDLVYQNYPHPRYDQKNNEFVSHLSVVDALMFAGPNVKKFVGISHSKQK